MATAAAPVAIGSSPLKRARGNEATDVKSESQASPATITPAEAATLSAAETAALIKLTDAVTAMSASIKPRQKVSYATISKLGIPCSKGRGFGADDKVSECYFAYNFHDEEGRRLETETPEAKRHYIQTRGAKRYFCSHDRNTIAGCCFVCGNTIAAMQVELDGSESIKTRPIALSVKEHMPYYKPGVPEEHMRICDGCEAKHTPAGATKLDRSDTKACRAFLSKAFSATAGKTPIVCSKEHKALADFSNKRVIAAIKTASDAEYKSVTPARVVPWNDTLGRFSKMLTNLAPVFDMMSYDDLKRYVGVLAMSDDKIKACRSLTELVQLIGTFVAEVIPGAPKL